jgi:hypothetical protein
MKVPSSASPQVSYKPPTLRKCPRPSSNFTGRRDILEKMHEYFSCDLGKRLIFVLHGIGGIGKSEILHKFIEECQVDMKPRRCVAYSFLLSNLSH